MEKLPGSQPEDAAADNHNDDKSSKRRRRRTRLPLASMVAPTPAAENAVEGSGRRLVKLDRELVELVVRKKLEDGEHHPVDTKLDSVEKLENEAESAVMARDAETLEDSLVRGAEAESEEEQASKAEDAPYEILRDYDSLGANEFVGDIVISLRDPIEGRTTASEGRSEDGASPAEAASYGTTNVQAGPARAPERPLRPVLGEGEGAPLSGSAGAGGNIPPRPPEVLSGAPGEPPEHSNVSTAFQAERARLAHNDGAYDIHLSPSEVVPRLAVEAESTVTKEDLDDAVYYATKAGQNRGVATGLLVGAGYEHFKHKKREKKAEKRHQTQVRQFETAEKAASIRSEEQERQKNELERRLNVTEHKLSDVEERFQKQPDQVHTEKQPVVIPEQSNNEQLEVPPEHRLESSAWHSIEVDARTGRPVESPTFAYGEEYYKERAKENGQTMQSGGPVAGPTMAGVPAGQQGSSAPGDSPSLPPVDLPSASMQGPPSSTEQQMPKATTKSRVATGQTAGPIWPWLVALLAIIISLALILR
ncbi:MAG TPA: hypothetical protein VLG92_01245 [Candidatus Saccharimonadia bacterium]|nr:hypothetical protein [Candidatus Saccharimonadia bacterium]